MSHFIINLINDCTSSNAALETVTLAEGTTMQSATNFVDVLFPYIAYLIEFSRNGSLYPINRDRLCLGLDGIVVLVQKILSLLILTREKLNMHDDTCAREKILQLALFYNDMKNNVIPVQPPLPFCANGVNRIDITLLATATQRVVTTTRTSIRARELKRKMEEDVAASKRIKMSDNEFVMGKAASDKERASSAPLVSDLTSQDMLESTTLVSSAAPINKISFEYEFAKATKHVSDCLFDAGTPHVFDP